MRNNRNFFQRKYKSDLQLIRNQQLHLWNSLIAVEYLTVASRIQHAHGYHTCAAFCYCLLILCFLQSDTVQMILMFIAVLLHCGVWTVQARRWTACIWSWIIVLCSWITPCCGSFWENKTVWSWSDLSRGVYHHSFPECLLLYWLIWRG